jgi:hypothetical protein
VSVNLQIDADGNGLLKITLDPDRSQQPERITLHIPDGFSQVRREGEDADFIKGRTLSLPFMPQQQIHLLRR